MIADFRAAFDDRIGVVVPQRWPYSLPASIESEGEYGPDCSGVGTAKNPPVSAGGACHSLGLRGG